jgi:predicted metal-dependent HD superfamily phosphohydrolase
MRQRFIELWDRVGAKGNPSKMFENLSRLYSNPVRVYHNLSHIQDCLNEFDSASILTQFPDEVELALWYHDSVYDLPGEDNEGKSAQLVQDILLNASLSERSIQRVHDLILITGHVLLPEEMDGMILADADLSILGKPRGDFDRYRRNIRKEYAVIPEDQFSEGRRKVLQMFLDREAIYSSDFFRDRYEEQAKANLQWEINLLQDQF